MSDANLRSVLRARLLTVTGLPAMAPVNRDFTPSPDAAWVQDAVLFGTESQVTFPAQRADVERTGIYQVDTYHPVGGGPVPIDTLAEAILSVFRPGQSLTTGTADRPLHVRRVSRFTLGRDGPWVRTMFRIEWRHVTQNNLTLA